MTGAFNPVWVLVGVTLLGLLGQFFGFLYLTKNHLHTMQTSLDAVVVEQKQTNTRLSRLEGRAWRD